MYNFINFFNNFQAMRFLVSLVHFLIGCMLLTGITNLLQLFDKSKNECKMTYMYEYPEYAKVFKKHIFNKGIIINALFYRYP